MSPRSSKVAKAQDTQQRLEAAESAAETVKEQEDRVDERLSLVGKLTDGWRRVHERNHLAELFQQEYGGTR